MKSVISGRIKIEVTNWRGQGCCCQFYLHSLSSPKVNKTIIKQLRSSTPVNHFPIIIDDINMAGVLNKQDQENLIYGHQQTAASKPLNQLRPKTPGPKSSKVSFDENAVQTHAKTVLKGGPSNHIALGGSKIAVPLVTPAATKNRLPLGAKTTNAKAKPFTTPTLQTKAADKAKSNSATRRQSLKISQTQPVKIDVLQVSEDDVPDVEYMPPRAKDIPDIPEELENGINLSMFENGGMQRDLLSHMQHSIGFDGKSMAEHQREREQILHEIGEARDIALTEYRMDCDLVACLHDPECPTEECKDVAERRRTAQKKYKERMAEISQMDKPPKDSQPIRTILKADITKGPSTAASRKAAAALAAKPTSTLTTKPEQKLPVPKSAGSLFPRATRPQNTVNPTNPSSMRHAAAVVASNTTLGYGKGRTARANLREGILSPKDRNIKISNSTVTHKNKKSVDLNALAPADYMRLHGEPKFLSEMWWKCRTAGLIKMPGDNEKDSEEDIQAVLFHGIDVAGIEREEAEREFELALP